MRRGDWWDWRLPSPISLPDPGAPPRARSYKQEKAAGEKGERVEQLRDGVTDEAKVANDSDEIRVN